MRGEACKLPFIVSSKFCSSDISDLGPSGSLHSATATGAEAISTIQQNRVPRGKTTFRDVSDALVEYGKVKEIRARQESLAPTLQDRSRLANLRYQGGVDTQLNVLDADRDLFAAELSLTQTRRNELLALVQLYKALGGGWQQ